MKIPVCWIAVLFTFTASAPAFADVATKNQILAAVDDAGHKIFPQNSKFKAILLVGYLKGCPIFRKYQPTLKEFKLKYKDKLLIVNFDPSKGAEKSVKESLRDLKELKNGFPFVTDPTGKLNSAIQMSTASEAVIIETADFDVVYRGAIDDQITYEYSKPKAQNSYAKDVIDKIVGGEKGKFFSTTPFGCALNVK